MEQGRYIPAGRVAFALLRIKKEMLDLVREGDVTPENVAGVIDGWLAGLELTKADAVAASGPEVKPEATAG